MRGEFLTVGLYRTQHQKVVTAGGRNFQGAFDVLLAHDFGKVHREAAVFFKDVNDFCFFRCDPGKSG